MRNNVANETQIKLLHDDLDVLRKKLETKNQFLENREQFVKTIEKELETTKSQSQKQTHIIKVKIFNFIFNLIFLNIYNKNKILLKFILKNSFLN